MSIESELAKRDRLLAAKSARIRELEAQQGTRWHQLFGTPERAAETLAMSCYGATSDGCETCVNDECDGKLRNSGTYQTVYDALLEWLRGDA